MYHQHVEPASTVLVWPEEAHLPGPEQPVEALVPAAAQAIEGQPGGALLDQDGRHLDPGDARGLAKVVDQVCHAQEVHATEVAIL